VLELNQFRRASQQSIREAYEEIQEHVAEAGKAVSEQAGTLLKGTTEMAAALAEITAKLKEMQLPEQIIAIKLSPLSKAFAASVETFSKQTSVQTAELTKILEKLYELQKDRENNAAHLGAMVPLFERASRSMETTLPRLDSLAAELRRRMEEAEARRRAGERVL
jgi:Tfp pilus assembly PilM family ATPase